MNEYNLRKLILSSPNLEANEKILLLCICFRVNWETWTGPVSVSNLANLSSMSERNARRIVSKLIKKGVIFRSSTREKGASKNSPSETRINLSFFSHHDKIDTDKVDTDKVDTDKVDTDKVVPLHHDKVVPSHHDKVVPHTIGYNNNNNISLVTDRTEHARKWIGWGAVREEDKEEEKETPLQGKKVYSFTYQSSIKDPEERLRVENHVKKNYHRLTRSDRDRLLNPDFTKPLIKANR